MNIRVVYIAQRATKLPIDRQQRHPFIHYFSNQSAAEFTIEPTAIIKNRNFIQLNISILISKGPRHLTVLSGKQQLRQFPVAIGKPATPTPVGNFAIATKVLSPGGVLGSRWMGLSYDSYGIHGTNAPWLIGKMVSHGCIRMHNHHAEELFAMVRLGTPVLIRD